MLCWHLNAICLENQIQNGKKQWKARLLHPLSLSNICLIETFSCWACYTHITLSDGNSGIDSFYLLYPLTICIRLICQ